MKKKYLILLLFFVGALTGFSQEITVKGRVSDPNGNSLHSFATQSPLPVLKFTYLVLKLGVKKSFTALPTFFKPRLDFPT